MLMSADQAKYTTHQNRIRFMQQELDRIKSIPTLTNAVGAVAAVIDDAVKNRGTTVKFSMTLLEQHTKDTEFLPRDIAQILVTFGYAVDVKYFPTMPEGLMTVTWASGIAD